MGCQDEGQRLHWIDLPIGGRRFTQQQSVEFVCDPFRNGIALEESVDQRQTKHPDARIA